MPRDQSAAAKNSLNRNQWRQTDMAEVEKSRQTHTRLSWPHPHFAFVTYPSCWVPDLRITQLRDCAPKDFQECY